jgi:TrmH family RNA methyltransferase
VINASMGSFARVVTHRTDLAHALSGVSRDTPILGCDLAGTSVYAVPPATTAVVVIGSEGRGLSAAVAARVTCRVTIPRIGRAESLNAAVAAGIVCAQLRRT